MKKIFAYLFFICPFFSGTAQNILNGYIHEGLENNESIKQQNFLLEKNLYALKESYSLFFPTLTLSGSYSLAEGGRTVDFPAGDILNPVFNTLNELTESQTFHEMKNMEIQLNPDDYYDAKVRLAYQIFNAELLYNRKIKKAIVSRQEEEVLLYKRELVKDIKIAYYQYGQALKNVEIKKYAIEIAKENQRINQSLYENGKTNYTTLIRSENEITKSESALFSASQKLKNSQAYFNFLLNRPFDTPVITEEPDISLIQNTDHLFIDNREEIKKLQYATAIKYQYKGLAQSFLLPKISTYLDLGSQGFNWKYNDKTRYYLFGISLQWTFSLGGQHIHQINQAKTDLDFIDSQNKEVKEQLALQLERSVNNYRDALNEYSAVISQTHTTERYFQDMKKLYQEGKALYIELLDAQTQLIVTQEKMNIARYNVCTRQAEVERANASYDLNNY